MFGHVQSHRGKMTGFAFRVALLSPFLKFGTTAGCLSGPRLLLRCSCSLVEVWILGKVCVWFRQEDVVAEWVVCFHSVAAVMWTATMVSDTALVILLWYTTAQKYFSLFTGCCAAADAFGMAVCFAITAAAVQPL